MSDWKEIAPGRFVRPTDSLEAFYIATADIGKPLGTEHLAFSFGIQLQHQYSDLVGALRNAWIRVRDEHPKLAATVEASNLVYEKISSDQAAIDAYLAETFKIVEPTIKSAAELFPSLNAPPARTILYYVPASSEIFIYTAHWRIDGLGALKFLDLLLDHVAAAEPSSPLPSLLSGAEEANLTPGFDTVLNLNAQPPESVTAVSTNALVNFGAHQPAMSIPFSTAPPVPCPTTHRQQVVFSRSLSDAIADAAKKRDISVTVAAHAALIHATIALKAAENPATSYASWVAFSVRNKLPERYKGPAYAVAGAHTGWPLALTPTDYENDICVLQKFYQEGVSSPETIASLRAFHNALTALLSQPLPPGAPIPAYPALNSIGIVDNSIKSVYGEGDSEIKTQNFWLGNAVMSLDIWVHIWNWQGQITLSGLHNVGVYDDQKIVDFLEKIKQVMVAGLGLTE